MSNKTIKEIVELLHKKKCLKSKINRTFKLNHAADEEETNYWVSAPYTLDTFEAILAYIQFECEDLEMSYGMGQDEAIEVLEQFYDCKKIDKPMSGSYFNTDLYYSREYFCGKNLQEVTILKRNGMDTYFKKYIEKFYDSYPEWRPKDVTTN